MDYARMNESEDVDALRAKVRHHARRNEWDDARPLAYRLALDENVRFDSRRMPTHWRGVLLAPDALKWWALDCASHVVGVIGSCSLAALTEMRASMHIAVAFLRGDVTESHLHMALSCARRNADAVRRQFGRNRQISDAASSVSYAIASCTDGTLSHRYTSNIAADMANTATDDPWFPGFMRQRLLMRAFGIDADPNTHHNP